MKKDWLKNPDVCAKVTAAVFFGGLVFGYSLFADDFFNKTFTPQSAAMSTAWWNICAPLDRGRF